MGYRRITVEFYNVKLLFMGKLSRKYTCITKFEQFYSYAPNFEKNLILALHNYRYKFVNKSCCFVTNIKLQNVLYTLLESFFSFLLH